MVVVVMKDVNEKESRFYTYRKRLTWLRMIDQQSAQGPPPDFHPDQIEILATRKDLSQPHLNTPLEYIEHSQ